MLVTEELITRKELGKRLKISIDKIHNLEEEGLPVMKIAYRTYRYDYNKVLEWINLQKLKHNKKEVKNNV